MHINGRYSQYGVFDGTQCMGGDSGACIEVAHDSNEFALSFQFRILFDKTDRGRYVCGRLDTMRVL